MLTFDEQFLFQLYFFTNVYVLQTKELLVLKSNVSNITATAAIKATTMGTTATTATVATAATMATTASLLKTTSTGSVLVALAFMNSTTSNITKLKLPVIRTIDTQPNCYRQQIECPFSWPAVRYIPTDVHPPKVDGYIPSSNAPLEFGTTAADISSIVDLSSGAGTGLTTGVLGANRNGSARWTESTAETTFKTIDDLQITADVIYYDDTFSSEDTATASEFNVSYTHRYDGATENSTEGLVSTEPMTENSTMDPVDVGLTITNPTNVLSEDFSSIISQSTSSTTQSAIDETISSESMELTPSTTPKLMASLDVEVLIANTTIDQSIITIDNDDEPYTTIASDDLKLWRTDEIIASSEGRRIVKRMSEVIFNGTHCFQVVCSSPSPVTNVTEVPNGFQGFSEKSSKYQSVYSYVYCLYTR